MTWYANGTVALTANSPVVNGTGTAFVANVLPGDALIVTGSGVPPVEIGAVNSDGQMTLVRPWPGSGGSGAAFTILPTAGRINELARDVGNLLATFAGVRDGIGQGLIADGVQGAPGIRFLADQDTGLYRLGTDTFGAAAGGRLVMRIAAFTALYANQANGYALDLIGRSDDSANLRLINAAGTVATGMLGFDPSFGMQLVVGAGGHRVIVPTGAVGEVRIGGVVATQTYATVFRAGVDNALVLGDSGSRWAQVYAATGAINTSDEREKVWRGSLTEAELAAARAIARDIGVYQWIESIADKGPDGARLHVGVRAQRVIALLEEHGLEPMRYAFVCYDEWEAIPAQPEQPEQPAVPEQRDRDGRLIRSASPGMPAIAGTPGREAGNRYGIRPDQLALFIAAAQEQRLAALEAR